MKKSLVFYLIIFFAQTSSFANSPFNNARLWNSWSIDSQEAYIAGVVDGIAESFFLTLSTVAKDQFLQQPPSPEVKKVTDHLFIRYTRDQLRPVITDLYHDPANSYVGTLDILLIARDKIEGKDISDKLLKARKEAMDNYELNQKMNKS